MQMSLSHAVHEADMSDTVINTLDTVYVLSVASLRESAPDAVQKSSFCFMLITSKHVCIQG